MACSNRNLLLNSRFLQGLPPWTGGNIKIVRNPVSRNDLAVLMRAGNPNANSVLKQTVYGPFERGCAYYLYFRVLNLTPARLFATVSYQDINGNIIRSTPLFILLGKESRLKWEPYFTIVPPPPDNVHRASVVLLLTSGTVLADNIVLASHQV
ncbi:hypothetical protein [Lihuaxuella thermophila]|uniref:Carbohydrate binding domain-containing protein n=1 Tax=Lihuaxuella thermophila TaxID=1173111 RepID=A0A1H8EWP4_9BACL|nr:hypothetical protein [Lihuaxuella thermophila]SEN23885.1 hypothetical protein SAMN05444955_107212 [Lihuaxuella thermophila]